MTPEEQTRRDTYLASLTVEQKTRFLSLETWKPPFVSDDLVCADCGAKLILSLGKFGRFYGCEKYPETGCKGGVSAHDNGLPKGWPGDAATRAARKKLVEKLEELSSYQPDVTEFTPADDLLHQVRRNLAGFLGKGIDFSIGKLTREECERALMAWECVLQPDGRQGQLLRVIFDPEGP